MMESLWQDVRHGVRGLVRTPGFTLTVALTLALGIGANAAVFSIINTLLLRPLPISHPDNLYLLTVVHQDNEQPHSVSWPDYVDYRDRSGVFSELAAYSLSFAGLRANDRADRVLIANVTGNFFTMLGVSPAYGRLILPSEGLKAGADPVVVLGHTYWARRFNRDPSVIGRQVLINAQPFTVVGVVPAKFTGLYALIELDAYIPHAMQMPASDYKTAIERRDEHDLRAVGRLKPGISLAQAQSAVDVLSRQLDQQYPVTNKTVRARIIPEHLARPEPNASGSNPFIAGVFLVLVGLVLLVACVNVVNLLLVRATVRQRELAVRAALGAGRRRLVRQLLTESLLLSAAGGVAGAALGRWLSALLAGISLPVDLPLRLDLGFDWRVFGYIAAIAIGAGVLVGVAPALRTARTDLNDALREGGRGMAEGSTHHRFRSALIVAQVAVSLVLLVAAGLFVRSVQRARSVDLGFHPQHVLNVSMDVSQLAYSEVRGRAFYRDLLDRVRQLPGVESVSYAYSVPFGYYSSNEFVEAEGQLIPQEQRRPVAGYNPVGPEYFRTLGITILKGRGFTEQDDERAPRVAVVNELMAARLWPGQDAIGKRFRVRDGGWLRVVGVTGTGKFLSMFEDPRMHFFLPLEQFYRPLRVLHARVSGAPELLAPAIQKEIRALDPDLPVYDVRPLTRALDGPNGYFLLEMGALFGAGLGLLGLVLALVGIYGVVSYTASQRTQEIGVRMALGAQRRDILRLVVGRGLLLVGSGIGIGLLVAVGLAHVLQNLLFGISSMDPATFIGVPVLLTAMAAPALYLPALRASKVHPMLALRQE